MDIFNIGNTYTDTYGNTLEVIRHDDTIHKYMIQYTRGDIMLYTIWHTYDYLIYLYNMKEIKESL